jgi:hypothetical protein
MMTKIYDLAYEIEENGNVQLEQDAGFGEVSRIELHPIHVRMLAEKTGILAPSSNLETDRTVARLCRQMRVLFERIGQLDDWLNQTAQRGHEDLENETAYSFATWELSREWVMELPDSIRATECAQPAVNGPQSGGLPIVNPPKRGDVETRKGPECGAVPGGSQQALGLGEVQA